MALQRKALIAQRWCGTSAYFEVINPEADEIYKKAVEVLDNWNSETRRIVAD